MRGLGVLGFRVRVIIRRMGFRVWGDFCSGAFKR